MPIKHETDHESLFQRAFAQQYNGKKMKKWVYQEREWIDDEWLGLFFFLSHQRLEKEYTVIRKDEQEEQIEIRVRTRLFTPHADRYHLFIYRN